MQGILNTGNVSGIDEMTGLRNKGSLTREINEFLVDSTTKKGILFVLDVDRFKSINDIYGHDVGDNVIIQLGGFLGSIFTNHEIVGRFGGDEFIVFIKNTNDLENARKIAKDLVEGVSKSVFLPNNEKRGKHQYWNCRLQRPREELLRAFQKSRHRHV